MTGYSRPTDLAAALSQLAARRPVILAGGTDHFPARMAAGPAEDILDITALAGLRAIERRGDHLWVPCLATWADLRAATLPAGLEAQAQAAAQIGGVQIQNAATLCGNLCNASPAADGIPPLLALDAEVELASLAGRRRMHLDAFLLGPRSTARRPEEMLLGLHIPLPMAPARSVFAKLGARRYLVISIVMLALVAEFRPDGMIARARVAVGACGPRAWRLPALEAALAGQFPDPALISPAHLAPLAPIDDIRGSGAYRLDAVATLLRRALADMVPT
jgi:CO/xanthine dehydrogenase FAD-binding subunit